MGPPPQKPSPDLESTRTAVASASSTRVFGSYRLIQRIGEGGMGEVWLAEQTTPVRRQVALKVIKAGMDTAQVVARFQAERQALALMDHPSIAPSRRRQHAEGPPYFVMEYVKGEPITTTATVTGSRRRIGWSCSCRSARACSTPTRRASSTATSSRPTSW